MSLQDHMLLWNQAALKVLDVRHAIMQPGEQLRAYQLLASAFLLPIRGKALMLLDQTAYETDKYHVCHAGKGTVLEIVQVADVFEYYMVFYQAVLTMPRRQDLLRLQQTSNPFQLQYGFAPRHPLSLYLRVEQMHREWQQNGMLEKFHVNVLFHQFVYELLKLQALEEETTLPKIVAQAIRYMDEHYAEPITLHSLAALLDCNARRLQRLFRAELHVGPMEYLIQVRLEKAKALLLQMDVPIAQIAEAVGYSDSYYFSRMFKKYMGISPSRFKEQAWHPQIRRQNPSRLSQSYIVSRKVPMYSDVVENGIHYQEGMGIHDYSGPTAASTADSHTIQPAVTNGKTGHVNSKGGKAGNIRINIKHLKGELELAQTPTKIVVLDYQYIDQLLALGKQPIGSVIGTSDTALFPGYLTDKLGDLKVVGTKEKPDVEAIAQAEPDLIICTEVQENIYDELVKIAPTLMLERNEDWRSTLPMLGKIMGRELEAQQVIDAYNRKIVHLKDALAAKLGSQTVSLIRPRDNMIRLHTTAHRTAKILYRDLGMAPPAMAMDSHRTSAFIALDAMPELNADCLFVLQDDSNAELTKAYQQTAIWKGLRVVKANRVCTVNTTVWVGYYGPLGNNLVVDQIAEALL
ncbi:AraC family transcriptional regulator [Brevibacillus sp. SYP-B805]|uniref:AraC family transcriptional regulator n=1 Tax=Brevibacillus sp. SYP-B805 TaxID=1578199 RepID=UPI0013EE1969|nr:AraC family transcriptional regulator [Brevibacillus sp. SYP-B805]NGQ94516.1 AraC family transcriptional regulator [Brevibacillus sp. SYP-B805]